MNLSSTLNDSSAHALQARQARVGLRVAGLLATSAARTPRDVDERLRFAREQAMSRARQQRQAAAAGAVQSGGSMALRGGPAWWLRTLAIAPVLLLAAGLVLVQHWSQREQSRAVAEVDAVLLADALPPGAYSDPGFAEYLRSPPP